MEGKESKRTGEKRDTVTQTYIKTDSKEVKRDKKTGTETEL